MLVVITTIIIIFIIIIILAIHCNVYQKISESIEIIQINDITKDNLEKNVKENKPIVIENISDNLEFSFKDNTKIELDNYFPKKKNNKKKK